MAWLEITSMFIHPKLLKAARLLLEISQVDLAKAAGISERSIRKIESFDADTTVRIIEAVQRALEDRGVIFLEDGETMGLKLPRALLQKTEK